MALGGVRTRRRSQTSVTLTCDGHWKVHKLHDDDGQTQTYDTLPGSQYFIGQYDAGNDTAGANILSAKKRLFLATSVTPLFQTRNNILRLTSRRRSVSGLSVSGTYLETIKISC